TRTIPRTRAPRRRATRQWAISWATTEAKSAAIHTSPVATALLPPLQSTATTKTTNSQKVQWRRMGIPATRPIGRLCPWPATGVCGPVELLLLPSLPPRGPSSPAVTTSTVLLCGRTGQGRTSRDRSRPSQPAIASPSAQRRVHQHRGPVHPVVCQVGERPVGLVERVGRGCHPQGDAGCVLEEFAAVRTGVGRHAAQRPLLEQMLLIVEHRDVRQVDTGAGQGA